MFTRITCDKKETEARADELMEQCDRRLKTDPNYGQNEYHLDYVRLKILKLLPEEHKTNPSDMSFMTNNNNEDDENSFMNGNFFDL